MWDLPGPGLEPVSPALAGGLSTTVLPGKSQNFFLYIITLLLGEVTVQTPNVDARKYLPLTPSF